MDEQLKRLSRGSGIYILTASTASQTALEKETDDHSLLTKHIIGGIRTGEAADEKTGLVTMEDLYRYVHRKVIAEGHHEPMRWALNVRGEELIIARAVKSRLDRLSRLPRKLRIRAQQVIDECQAQPDLHTGHIRLLEALFDNRIELGDFIDEWEQIESSVLPPHAASPPAQAVVQPPPKPQPKPPERVEPAQSYIEDLNGVPLEMILIPAGKFMMGSEKRDSEKPSHEVNVPAFCIGKFQITQAQWKAVIVDNPSHFKGDDLPVKTVKWDDAQEFCKKLQQHTRKAYRLPSEAEWEYACRAGTTGDYAGDLEKMAWYYENSGGKTHPTAASAAPSSRLPVSVWLSPPGRSNTLSSRRQFAGNLSFQDGYHFRKRHLRQFQCQFGFLLQSFFDPASDQGLILRLFFRRVSGA